MSRLEFEDDSFIELVFLEDKVSISLGARENDNLLKKRINAVELTMEQFKELFKDCPINLSRAE